MKRLTAVLFLSLFVVIVSGCGQKGPLVPPPATNFKSISNE